MQETFDLIKHVNHTVNMYGSYPALFYISLLYLFLRNRRKGNRLFYMSLAGLLFIWNPLFAAAVIKLVPAFEGYWQLLWIIPQTGIMVYAAASAYELILVGLRQETEDLTACRIKWKGRLTCILACLVLGVIIALSGTGVPYRSSAQEAENSFGIKEADREVLELLSSEGEVMLLAPDTILESARQYNANIYTVYGRDLWTAQLREQSGYKVTYNEELYQLYNLMRQPEENLAEIAGLAAKWSCTHLVLPAPGQKEPAVNLGDYRLQVRTDAYLLYNRQH